MRITINIYDEVLELVSQYAKNRGVSLDCAVADLLRKGLESKRATRTVSDIRVLDLPPNSPKVTSRKVRDLESEPECE